MAVLRGAYCGLAPVPGGRVNVGIVLADSAWRRRLAKDGAAATSAAILREAWPDGPREPTDHIAGVAPIGQRVARRAGPGWFLVGDAAGVLDPFTGEGLHRALVSARLAAEAAVAFLAGRTRAPADYDAAMTRRFRAKDFVSWVVQGFVAQPRLFDYATARLARRQTVGNRFGRIMGDLAPAADAFDPRFLARLLAP
jgi:flavin-dependent dehydrogenase